MSILIKGMKMPTSCFRCPLSVLNGERLYCEVTKDEVLRAKRSSDCPLVELPPHGRLIDADAVQETVLKLVEGGWDITRNDYKRMDGILFECPTIIEAEGEDGT